MKKRTARVISQLREVYPAWLWSYDRDNSRWEARNVLGGSVQAIVRAYSHIANAEIGEFRVEYRIAYPPSNASGPSRVLGYTYYD